MTQHQVDVAVVGSGPGGATVARELARAGRRVLLLERGRDWRKHPLYGTYPGVLLYADKNALMFTREGLNIVRPLMVGGATSMYCGCSARRTVGRERYHIDLDPYADA
jgi:choline dehydrogenase-like flavoprotein